jgi:hypothetical protein
MQAPISGPALAIKPSAQIPKALRLPAWRGILANHYNVGLLGDLISAAGENCSEERNFKKLAGFQGDSIAQAKIFLVNNYNKYNRNVCC